MRIELLVRNYGRMIGLSRYTSALVKALTASGIGFSLVTPEFPWTIKLAHKILRPLNFDVKTFFTTYPVKARFSRSSLKHLTTQQMASLLWIYPKLSPTVITVHDIVPYIVNENREQTTYRHALDRLFDHQAMKSIKKADAIITVSNCTEDELIKHLGCDDERIYVIYEGVDRALFRPIEVPDMFLDRYGLDRTRDYLLFVGSDNPRKNLPRVIQAFVKLHRLHPEARFIKIGTIENMVEHEKHKQMITDAGMDNVIYWLNQVPEEDLVLFYNLAKGYIFPSLYEGFGLPVLEAMACGTPVVTSNTSSLPEVAGEAALLVDPYDVDAIAESMRRVLEDEALVEDLRERGLKRASQFTWEKTARETIAVYEKVLGEKLL